MGAVFWSALQNRDPHLSARFAKDFEITKSLRCSSEGFCVGFLFRLGRSETARADLHFALVGIAHLQIDVLQPFSGNVGVAAADAVHGGPATLGAKSGHKV